MTSTINGNRSAQSGFLAFILIFLFIASAIGKDVGAEHHLLSEEEKTWLSAHPTIRLAFDSNYPPYSFKNDQGEFVGIAVDIADRLSELLNVTFEVYPHGQWQQLYSAAQHGQVDVIATLVKRPGREAWFEFTRPYLSLTQYVITRHNMLDTFRYQRHLQQRRIALIQGYSTTQMVLTEIPEIKPVYVTNLEEALEKVSTGQADVAIGDIGMAQHLMLKMGLLNLGFAFPYTKSESKQRFGVRKDWPQLATILDKALSAIEYTDLIHIYSRWNMPDRIKPEAGFLSVAEKLTDAEKSWLDQHPTIRLASDFAWPPFETVSKEGIYSGIAADYIQLIEEKLGVEFIVSPYKPWSEVLERFKNKQLDLLTCAMETEARKPYAHFTTPYISHQMVIVTRDDVDFIDGLTSLKNKTIAIEESYASYDIMSKDHPDLKLIPFPDSLSAMKAVSSGQIFSYIGNVATLSHIVREHGLTNIKVSGQAPYRFDLSIGVRDDWPELASIIQKTLDSISIEQRNEILQKWIAVEVRKPFDYTIVWQISMALSAILFLIIFWNLSLKRTVHKRTAELDYQAHFDALTDLPNRALAFKRLENMIQTNPKQNIMAGILFLDLDNFKKINDSLGHETGDLLIVAVAHRIKLCVHSADTVSRLGGDEFIIFKSQVQNHQELISLAHNLLDCFQNSFSINGRELLLSASIGIAIYPEHGKTPSELLRHADTAMYNAKYAGRNTYRFFTLAMSQIMNRQLTLEEHMQNAIENNEFKTYYQPKVNLATGKLVGFEALLRWTNATLGSVSPLEFITIAEKNGLILKLGDFVLKSAISACKVWQTQFNRPFTISVNMSPRQFRDQNIANQIADLLSDYRLMGNNLELEITENVLINEFADALKTLISIQSTGVKLAMDDFGTGYSSLSYLKNYPFDTLKIDREFINEITQKDSDKTLASATITMAHGLGLQVVAEGIETREQLKLLTQLQCDLGQGYYFSRPMSFSQTTEYIQAYDKNHKKN